MRPTTRRIELKSGTVIVAVKRPVPRKRYSFVSYCLEYPRQPKQKD